MRRRAFVALLASVLVAGCREVTTPPEQTPSVAQATPLEARLIYPSVPASFVDLVASARHAVVGIRATTPVKSGPAAMFPGAPDSTPDVALGTGFLIEARGVYVLTNDHVAAGAAELQVTLSDGASVPAKVIGRDPRLDLALLSIDVPRLHPLQLGNSDALRVGEWIVVLGNPFGDEVTAAAGIVSATGREGGSLVQGRTIGHRTYLQTDARIHRGNSGGPVLDTSGQVIGVAVANGERTGELSFAIPINRVKEIVEALRDHGQVARGWLGVLVKPVDPALAQTLALPAVTGAYITEVKAGSPAARSALRVGDVILQWGTSKVDHRALPWVVAASPINTKIEVIVWRNKAEMKLGVLTERMPE
jgi:serine protease Do